MSAITYQDALHITRQLALPERLQLLKALAEMIEQDMITLPPHTMRDIRGLGKELWAKIDVDAYLERERDTWDG